MSSLIVDKCLNELQIVSPNAIWSILALVQVNLIVRYPLVVSIVHTSVISPVKYLCPIDC